MFRLFVISRLIFNVDKLGNRRCVIFVLSQFCIHSIEENDRLQVGELTGIVKDTCSN